MKQSNNKAKQIMKKTMLFMAALGLVALQACQKVIDTGTCGAGDDGSNLTWTLTDDGTLTISGIGDMANYEAVDNSTISSPFFAMRGLIRTIVIEKGVASIGNLTFAFCLGMTSVVLPDGLTDIGDMAFLGCTDLTSVTIPGSVVHIESRAFGACTSLTSVVLPDGLTEIRDLTFVGCTSLTSVSIPESVTSIGESAFFDCTNLALITIPEGVTSIWGWAFAGCGLTSITIPESVTSIGESAFSNTELTEIKVMATTPPFISLDDESTLDDSEATFSGVDTSIPVYVPANSVENYRNSTWGRVFSNIQPM